MPYNYTPCGCCGILIKGALVGAAAGDFFLGMIDKRFSAINGAALFTGSILASTYLYQLSEINNILNILAIALIALNAASIATNMYNMVINPIRAVDNIPTASLIQNETIVINDAILLPDNYIIDHAIFDNNKGS